ALAQAAARGKVIPVYILDEHSDGLRPIGSASRWWLHHSLCSLRESLPSLRLMRGNPLEVLSKLAKDTGADAVFWNRCYEPDIIRRDKHIKADLQAAGLSVQSFNGSLLHEPWEVETGQGGPFKVYSPFWRAAKAKDVAPPLAAPSPIDTDQPKDPEGLDGWHLLPKNPDWSEGWDELWQPGEGGARKRLEGFLATGLKGYGTLRNRPDLPNVSRLSPHLHFGEISPRQIWHATAFVAAKDPSLQKDADKFLSEVGWREFSYHLLYHFPTLPSSNWKPAFDNYPWRESAADLRAWQRGMTGYPIVDAGMRELWQTGYMHNRVRMVVASFLVKHLRLHWKQGEDWFWDTLLDADQANNAASWQWVAGSGADAAPYFRIFNPMTQGRKFDPDGTYVRRWCPELAKLDNTLIHAPFEASQGELEAASITLGQSYPRPIVDHAQARAAALDGYEAVKIATG
ncbi:MAG: deoxyribodipyrimidine photo-lyase, partial [Pseudomonadota bacterium]